MKTEVNKVYDPAVGSGSLLLKFAKILGKDNVRNGFFGQEINITTYNLCRINMFLHDIGYDKFSIEHGDTLTDPKHWDEEPFEAIVSNPPYSIKWEGSDKGTLINDPRFSPAGVLAPKSKADFAFIMHCLHWLATDGTAAIVCFPGIMYRGGAEQKIRKYLIDNNYIECIIQLPDNLFYGTSIATCIMVLKKSKVDNQTLFIDASKEFVKSTNSNKLGDGRSSNEPDNIQDILNAYIKVITNVEKMAKSKNNTVSEQKSTAKVNGFNSIFAVASIPAAIAYYNEFKKQMEETGHKLNIATIFSFNPNEEDPDDILQDENFDTSGLDQTSRDFLDSAIDDYNKLFNVSYDTSADKFPNYYKDVSLRMKNREIDLLIVVNMFLTGFDATTLNTLWVDKNLKDHGLIQAFSRTNRILNSVKTFGNIVCFRNLETATNNALALFGDKNARGMVILKTYNEYMDGYEDEHGKHIEGYNELVARLEDEFPISSQIIGEDNEKEFIKLFGRILKLRNILRCFDDFESDSSVSVRDLQDYQSIYIDLYQDYAKKSDIEKERINDDIVFEIELIKQVEVNIDYILMLVAKYHESNCEDKTILANINKSIDASVELRSKKALIEGFVAQMTVKTDVEKDWKDFVKKQKEQDLEAIIKDEKLKHDEAQKFMENSFRDGGIKTTGTDLDKILPPISRFSGGSNRALKKQTVIDKLKDFFEKYFGLV